MINCTRRSLVLGVGAVALTAAPFRVAAAETWPARPIRMLVGYPAGGANDLVARAVAGALSDALAANLVIDNRSGAAGTLAAEAAARSAPDGYTLFMMASAQVLAPSLKKNLAYDPIRDFSAVALTARSSYVLVVHPSVPIHSTAELIAHAKANPGSLTYASSGVGAGPHLATELFASMAGVRLTHVPYRGDTPGLTDLLAGQVEMAFMSMAPAVPHVKSGALRALAVASGTRSSALPEGATLAETALPGYDVRSWWGLVAPAGTPREVIDKVEALVVPFLRKDETRARFLDMALEPGDKDAAAF